MSAKLHDLDRLNEGLAGRIDDLMPRLFLNAVKVGGYWEMRDLSGAPGDNLKVWRKGAKQGEWCDFAANRGGRPLGLVIASPFAGGDNAGEGIRWAARFLGLDDSETDEQRAKREEEAARQRFERARLERQEDERRRRSAQALFLSGAPIAGTLADRYLQGRAIDLRAFGRQPGALRFHGAVKCPETGVNRPAMLAAVSGSAGFLTVHRTFLFAKPNGDVVKADAGGGMRDAKQTYSARADGCIAIWRGDSGKPLRSMPEGEWVIACEGIEDALTIALAMPDMRVIATIALDGLGKVWLPKACAGLFWHRHRGDGPQAVAAYEKQAALVRGRGLALKEVWAPGEAKDFNAWAMDQAQKVSA